VAKGLFSRFMRALRSEWRTVLPAAEGVPEAFSALMPKASTFHIPLLGVPPGVSPHLFLVFQHNTQPWKEGQFTINVVVASRFGAPGRDNRKPSTFGRGDEGHYRIGGLTHGKDKWWALTPGMFDDEPLVQRHVRVLSSTGESTIRTTSAKSAIMLWHPTSYDDERIVFAEAIADVTIDVRAMLGRAALRCREDP